MDDLSKDCQAECLKRWADKCECAGQIKGGHVVLQHSTLVITSQHHHADALKDQNNELRDAINRRFRIVHFKNGRYKEPRDENGNVIEPPPKPHHDYPAGCDKWHDEVKALHWMKTGHHPSPDVTSRIEVWPPVEDYEIRETKAQLDALAASREEETKKQNLDDIEDDVHVDQDEQDDFDMRVLPTSELSEEAKERVKLRRLEKAKKKKTRRWTSSNPFLALRDQTELSTGGLNG